METLARATRKRDLRKFSLLLALYSRVASGFVTSRLVDDFRKNVRSVSKPDPANPEQTIEMDMSGELSWIAWAYGDLSEFFGEQSEDFYYQQVKEKLVPSYIDEAKFPIFAQILIKSYQESIEDMRKMLLEMLESVLAKARGKPSIEENNQ